MSSKCLKVYWASGLKSGKPNFGDALSPLVCELLSGRPAVHTRPNRCDLVAIGSILHRVSHRWFSRKVHVWGTGLMEQKTPFPSRHHYHALRGRLTQACLRHEGNPVLGDPGLLCHLLLDNPPRKQYPLGLAPHYADQDSPVIREFLARNPHAVLVDVLNEPRAVIEQISRCEVILSSSLHGLAASDALGIPNAWIRLSGHVRGRDFKFHDYYSVFGIDPQPFPLTALTQLEEVLALAESYSRPGLAKIQADLVASFPFKR